MRPGACFKALLGVGWLVGWLRGCIQKFVDWPPETRTANGTALCH
jgi:hypothetical protein